VSTRLEFSYGEYEQIEEALGEALDESLGPRGPDGLYDLVAGFGLEPGSVAVDGGCGEGRHALELARRFGFRVLAVDPFARSSWVDDERVSFTVGSVEALPVESGTADLVWCRDVLELVADLDRAYGELHRVLRPGGRALVYSMFATDWLEPGEADRLWGTHDVVPSSTDPATMEAAMEAAGFRIDEQVVIGSDWGEHAQETSGKPGRLLLHAARLLRDPERYVSQFGRDAYEIRLADCFWHVYAMIGKLERRAYVLTRG
jgi:SAM-dependent methyltransferase